LRPGAARSGRSFGRRLCLKPLLGDGKFIAERDPCVAKKHPEHAASMHDAVEFDELEDFLYTARNGTSYQAATLARSLIATENLCGAAKGVGARIR
jgi:hypothetical protein